MNAASSTLDANQSLAEKLRGFGAKLLARAVGTSPRTTENWLMGAAAPTWKHIRTMMSDDALLDALLRAADRGDAADRLKASMTIADARRVLSALDAPTTTEPKPARHTGSDEH